MTDQPVPPSDPPESQLHSHDRLRGFAPRLTLDDPLEDVSFLGWEADEEEETSNRSGWQVYNFLHSLFAH